MEDLIGKEVRGFKFSSGPGYVTRMNDYIGVIGKIRYVSCNVVNVRFPNHDTWAYPYPEALDHLVVEEEEQSIEEILNNIKNLTKQI